MGALDLPALGTAPRNRPRIQEQGPRASNVGTALRGGFAVRTWCIDGGAGIGNSQRAGIDFAGARLG